MKTRAKTDSKVRVVVLTGKGKYFCTGLNLGSLSSQTKSQTVGGGAHRSQTLFETLYQFPKPIIARLNGPALGGGVGLVFTTDIRIAVRNSFLSFPEVRRGIVPALISLYIVPQLGPSASKQFFMTGGKITAERAHQLGVISDIVDTEEEMDKKIEEYVKELISGGPGAIRDIKQLVSYLSMHGPTREENVNYVQKVFGKMMTSEEAALGVSSFLQKKEADWDSLQTTTTTSKL